MPARAQEGFGFQGGATIDPDQGYFGMHVFTRPLGGNLRLHPAGDVGFGDNVVLASLHVDFAQWFDIGRTWRIYFGGGPAVNIYRFDVQGHGGEDSTTDVEGGFDTIVGFATRSGFLFEMRVGASGSPNLRFGVGYTFH
jgi:hypothetical protein